MHIFKTSWSTALPGQWGDQCIDANIMIKMFNEIKARGAQVNKFALSEQFMRKINAGNFDYHVSIKVHSF